MRVPLLLTALLVAAGSTPAAGPLGAQASDRARVALGGAVVDHATGAPVEGASVVLQPEVAGAFPGPAAGSAFAAATRAATSDSAGRYRFDGLAPGVYRLYVSRMGYRPYSVVVELRGARETAVSIGLTAEAIRLGDVRARSRPRGPYAAAADLSDGSALARLMAADLRRRRFLTTDVRELTHADVVEAVTLGEPDLLRALQRLPGVATRSDYTAELWTRGAPWSQTRVYFDGVPLFNPLHALGLISGIGSSAVGAAWFHPGVRSAAIGEGAAGVVDLQSRRGGGAGELNLQADVSLATAGLALDQRVLDGRAGWMVAGRHTYLDWLADLARRAADNETSFPYSFGEVTGRVDAWIGDRTVIEASGLWEGDRLSSEHQDSLGVLRADWGNAVGRVTLTTRLGALHARHTLGTSRHHGFVGSRATGPEFAASPATAWELGQSRVEHHGFHGSFWPEPVSIAGPAWTFGYGLELNRVHYDGPAALPVPRTVAQTIELSDIGGFGDSTRVSWTSELPVGVVWGERSWSPSERLSLRAGLRVEAGEEVANGGVVRAAPRLSVRWAPVPELALSAGFGRAFQYTQALAPGGVQLASLVSSDVWLLADRRVPAIRADVATLGLEAWVAPGRVATLNGFGRLTTGLALPDPRPGPVFGRADFVTGENTAYGLEAGIRQISGRLTGSLSYTLLRSRTGAAGLTYPSAADRTHVLDATAMVRALPSLRLGAAFTAATGVPFTRTISDPVECSAFPGCDPERLPWSGAPHAERAPAFASLDLLVDWSARYAGLEIGVYAQLRNVLGRANATVYTGDVVACLPVGCGPGDLHNVYERGVPRLPVIGVRVRR